MGLRLWGPSHINNNIYVEASLVSRSTSSHEVVDSRVGGDNLVVIGSRSIESRKCYRVGPSARGAVGQGLRRTHLRGQAGYRLSILNATLAELLVGVPPNRDGLSRVSVIFLACDLSPQAYHWDP